MASSVVDTKSIPTIDVSSPQHYLSSVKAIKGRMRQSRAIDLFVFSHSFPFESLHDVVVGRYFVDNEILAFCHLRQMRVVDLSNLYSYHQGTVNSSRKRIALSHKDFYFNQALLSSNDLSVMRLMSSLYVV